MTRKARDIPDLIQWAEGMLLTPQHFQQMAGRQEFLSQYLATLTSPYPYGLLDFHFDGEQNGQITGGVLRISSLEAIMRDGLLAWGGSEFGVPLELNLERFAEQSAAKPVTVYLAVASQQNLTARGDLARYASIDADAVDENTGDRVLHLPRLRPRLELWAGDALPGRYHGLPLLKFSCRDKVYLVADYAPPHLLVTRRSAVWSLCSRLATQLRDKARVLAEKINSPAFQRGELASQEAILTCRSLVAALPALEALLHSERAHPYALYLAVCQAAGHVAPLSRAMVPPPFARYDHDEILESFLRVTVFIERAVSEGVPDRWKEVPFQLTEGEFRVPAAAGLEESLAFPASGDLAEPVLAMAVRAPSGVEEAAVLRWVENSLVGSESVIPDLRSKRTRGAERRHVERLPDLVAPGGMLLFALAADPDYIKPREPLCVYGEVGDEGQPIEAVLYLRVRPVAG